MFHLFGIMHTQMRKDRDQHITVLRQNIQRGVGSLEYNVRIDFKILIYTYLPNNLSNVRFVMNAITMGSPMTAPPSCTMGQKPSQQDSGL